MADIDIAVAMADAIRSDKRVSAAFYEWMRERYSIDISDEVRAQGIEAAFRLVHERSESRADAQDARADKTDALIAQLAEQTAAIRADTAATRAATAAMQLRMDASDAAQAEFRSELREHRETMRRLGLGQDRLNDTLSNYRGTIVETTLIGEFRRVLIKEMGCVDGEIIWVSILVRNLIGSSVIRAFEDKIKARYAAGDISEDEYIGLTSADFVASGILKDGGQTALFLGEASSSIEGDDVERASARAATLQRIEGMSVQPFVYGYRIRGGVRDFANRIGVKVALVAPPYEIWGESAQ